MSRVVARIGTQPRLAALVLVIAVLALAGCANTTGAQPAGSAVVPTAAVQATEAPALATEAPAVATEAPAAATEAPNATEAPAAATEAPAATAASGASGAATVMVSDNAEHGQILTDEKGMTLYLYTKDTPNTSNCYGQCAEKWPPLLTTGSATGGAGADSALLGTTQRTDGTTQVTYNGWPLYYWVGDAKAGDATGQNVGGVWFVVSPKGEAIK